MIPLNFVLFWAGSSLSYLRFLTFKSLRHFHPNSKIQLYVSHKYNKESHKWGDEKQDFEIETNGKNYLGEMKSLGVEVVDLEYVGNPELCPIFQADLFRWIWMGDNGGFYLDTDQIILKPFDDLPLDKEFIYCRYMEPQCGDYFPIGVLGLERGSEIANVAKTFTVSSYRPNNYNSSGPFMMREASKHMDLSRSFNAPFSYFYPINSSKDVDRIYEGRAKIFDESFSLHWFGGHTLSQEFNKNYTEEFARKSKDSISVLSRQMGIT